MSKVFTSTRNNNPCPLCNDTTGKCRITEKIYLCMNFAEAASGIPGYRFLGRTKDDVWGKWIEDTGRSWSEQEREEWQRERQRLQNLRAQEEQARRTLALPAQERDRLYTRLLDQLTLHPDDRADLLRRGLTPEQIQAWGVKSVEQWQALVLPLAHTLPGVTLTGTALNIAGDGYLCPIRDVDGQLVGFQVRLRDGEDGRYRWLTSATQKRPYGPTPHLPNGELPLAVHRPETVGRDAIALVEGVGAKPFILAQRLAIVTIGAAGGQFASSPQTLQHALEVLSAERGTRAIEFYPDAGAMLNRSVRRQYRKTWNLLRQWGYEVKIAWWGQETKDAPDIDELPDLTQITWLAISEYEDLAAPNFDWLERISRSLKRFRPESAAIALRQHLGELPTLEQVEYAGVDRLSLWQAGLQEGRYLLDTSAPGTGKSFAAGKLEPAAFGAAVRQVIYISDQHRNPTVATLEASNGWADLEARHAGLIRETTPGGGDRLKRATQGEIPSEAANCQRTRFIQVLRTQEVQGADTASLICGTCPLREACSHSAGSGYGFLHQRRLALSAAKLRAHPDSLPSPTEYDYSNVVLIWDEPGQILRVKRTIQVTLTDLEKTIAALLPHPALLEQVQGIAAALLPYLNGEGPLGKFGLSHQEVVQQLPESSGVDLAALTQVLQPDLSFLNTTAAYGTDLADLPPHLRKRFSEKDAELAEQAVQRVLKQWLPELVQVLTGQIQGFLYLDAEGLRITLPDTRQAAIAQAAKANLFLDSTLHPQDLALKLGVQTDSIRVVQQQVAAAKHLTVIQVTDLGRLGMQRGNEQQRRANALIAHYRSLDSSTQVIDFKRYATTGTGIWWRDSRGVNDFQQVRTLVLVGTPCRNLADLQAEYAILTGCPDPGDPNFQAFVDRVILADFHQAIGRLRAHRRPQEPLQIVLLTDFALDIPTQQIRARDITLEAATSAEQTWGRITLLIKELFQTLGRSPTQQEVSAAAKVKQSQISKLSDRFMGGWRTALKIFQTLLETPYSQWNIFSAPVTEDEQWMAKEYLPAVAAESVEEVVTQVGALLEAFGWETWRRLVAILEPEVRIRLAAAIAAGLPIEVQQQLLGTLQAQAIVAQGMRG